MNVAYAFLRTYVALALQLYYKRIIIQGRENIPAGPVIFVANHQNAFMDALLIVCFNKRRTYFLARADIFKSPLARRILSFLRILPVYRIRDGRPSLSENEKTFGESTAILARGDTVALFPEGNHGDPLRLRPLSKGFTRLAAQALQTQTDLSIVPVGPNYENPRNFRSRVSICFGEPIRPSALSSHSDAVTLTQEVSQRLKALIVHIPEEGDYDAVLNQLKLSQPDLTNPFETNQRIAMIMHGTFQGMKKNHAAPNKLINLPAILFHFMPVLIWWRIRRNIKDPVFISSLRFAAGLSLFAMYYLLILTLAAIFLGLWPAFVILVTGLASLMIWRQ